MKASLTVVDDSGHTYQGEVELALQGSIRRVQRIKISPVSYPKQPMEALKHLHQKRRLQDGTGPGCG